MRVTVATPVNLGPVTMAAAFERVFGLQTLRRMHGDSFEATAWAAQSRTVKFEIRFDAVPPEVRRFFCGDRLRVRLHQRATVQDGSVSVRDKMRMHFVGSELFIVRPRHRIEARPEGVFFTAEVENHAMLPPPLCNIVEAFMDASSRAQLERFSKILLEDDGGTAEKNNTS